MTVEYRVVWQRGYIGPRSNDPEDMGHPAAIRHKVYQTRAGAERLIALKLGDWAKLGKDPDGYACCDGWECQCGGLTNVQKFEDDKITYGPCDWARLEQRTVGQWEPS